MTFTALILAALAQTAPAAPATPPLPPAAAAPASAITPPSPPVTPVNPNLPTPENYTPAAPPNISTVATPGWVPLFNGVNLDNLYSFRQRDGKNNDVDHIFKVENGMIHALDVDDPSVSQPNGYLGTNEEFRNVHIRLEYQWGAKKLAVPRHPEGLARDAGLLYLTTGPDAVWPMCIECQIQERDTGDIWLLPNGTPCPIANTTVVSATPALRGVYTFQPGGAPYQVPVAATNHRLYHSAAYDQLSGWNTVEVYITENNAVHVVNGHVNNYLADIRLPTGEPLTQGRILLQQESNEVFYRNVSVQPLFATASGNPPYKVLVFSKTGGFRHASIPDGIAAIKKLGEQNGFTADASEDPAAFTDDNLKQYKALIFVSTTGNIFNDSQKQAFQNYIKAGGGYVGIHAASDTEYNWPWYGQLVGAYFSAHPSGTPTATVKLEDFTHPSTASLPSTWTRVDEWYNFKTNPRENVHVLATLDESSYRGGTMNGDHPVIWAHDFDGGRSWYTALGHTKESYTDPLFLMSLLGGIKYAAGTAGLMPTGAIDLLNLKDRSQSSIDISNEGSLAFGTSMGDLAKSGAEAKSNETITNSRITSKAAFQDFQLHVEFLVQAKPVTTPPHGLIMLQGLYGVKIADSFDRPLRNFDACGAIVGFKNPLVNASQPAETWQSFDITFRAAQWQGSRKIANARVTVYQNGILVQDNTDLSGEKPANGVGESSAGGPLEINCSGGITLRNIWIKPLSPSSTASAPAPASTTTASR